MCLFDSQGFCLFCNVAHLADGSAHAKQERNKTRLVKRGMPLHHQKGRAMRTVTRSLQVEEGRHSHGHALHCTDPIPHIDLLA